MSGQDDTARAQALQELHQLTGYSEERCIGLLEAADWDFGQAAQAFYLDQDREDEPSSAPSVPDNYTGPRTLDGRPAPESQRRAPAPAKKTQKRKGVATLGSLGGGGQHDDDDDDDDTDDVDEGRNPRDLFAGGEKSGLAVQDPTNQGDGGPMKIINDILAKAKANAAKSGSNSEAAAGPSRAPNTFRGAGRSLGGDGVESRTIPDPNAAEDNDASNEEPQERSLHLWRDGFSIDDGELHRFDDPANAADLAQIRAGRAPLHLMNVRYDQPVDVKLHQHEENYRRLPQTYKPFGGAGQRLGSEVPGDGNASAAPAAAPAPAAAASTSSAPSTTVDESLPTLTLRIQLPDGSRLPARFNTTQTLDDVYGFVSRASTDVAARPWVLATTFPNKEHTDRSLVLGEMPEFKKGGTAVVKWA
ncbi:hypothetical protein VD0002_g1946 [Verticillium dahliae]|uniref:UBX domain-containing protein n=2 Tax=Verticillium dahliae TaxID=27337 RepID=G2XGP5_VERDV|nr:UBX domain-containing protein [Verticillium dahliae VdLs.17]KAF3346974.1 Oligopeptide transporter 6 [Verticillium dahliae VDG2]KAF3358866.1 hypothetical protein VdG1_02778 [Verticillium dahliae VDG1]KAH6693006.1 UBX domain-containing protein [Verticillium dahliae]EGY18993.1 UBX domain-containing protein [Verticillium dahliae VdLs.17]PNH30564.1 hypothetical protein BJF96_g6096 [Verticillium dahliae]